MAIHCTGAYLIPLYPVFSLHSPLEYPFLPVGGKKQKAQKKKLKSGKSSFLYIRLLVFNQSHFWEPLSHLVGTDLSQALQMLL